VHRVLKEDGHFLLMDLRRNAPFLFRALLLAGEKLFAPNALRKENGASSSFRASYTPREIAMLMAQVPFARFSIKRGFGWVFVWATK
jgi:hypothetical protein